MLQSENDIVQLLFPFNIEWPLVPTTVVDRVVGFDLDKHNGFVSFVFILTRTMPSSVSLLTSTMASFKYCSNIV